MDDRETEFDQADVLIDGSRIVAVGPNLQLPTHLRSSRIIEADGLLAMPGLVNGHIHSPGNLMKGLVDDTPLEIFMLYEIPPFSRKPPSPRLNYVRTMLGIIEMLKLGITSVHDDAFYNPVPTPEAIDGLMQAYADSGMRATVTINQPNVLEYEKYPFLYDLLPDQLRKGMETALQMGTGELLELYGEFIRRWHGACDSRLGAAVSCSAPQRVTPEYLQALSELSRRYDIPFDIHILESKLQRVLGQEKYGKSFIRYVHDLGALDERMMVIHAIWIDELDMELMARAGCSVAHNPLCNLKIGDGIMPFRRLRNHGINICLGTDEATVDDTANLWGVGKVAGLVHKIAESEYRNWPTAREILWAMTRGGARAMRLEGRVGVLAPDWEADLILLDLNTIAFTPLNDLRRQLVFCENGSSVLLTMVAGQVVAEQGRVLTVDEDAIKSEVRQLMPLYREEIAETARNANVLEPYYREMYLRAAARDVGMNRWAGPMQP
jgi:cytosine/adenosine deaminase-related metal-dependent hydrolase